MEGRSDISNGYECVEPELGAELWQYDSPEIDSELRKRLDDHLTVCAYCRLAKAIPGAVGMALGAGEIVMPRSRPAFWRSPRTRRAWPAAATLALAASLALVFIMPPQGPGADRIERGAGEQVGFHRPVVNEVVGSRTPRLSWHPVPKATRYRITLSEVGGSYDWSMETTLTEVRVPASASLPPKARLRAILEPIPSYAAPTSGLSVSFRTDSADAFVQYRLQAAPAWLLALAGISLLALVAGLVVPRVQARSV